VRKAAAMDVAPNEAQVISTLSRFEFRERERVEYTEMQSVSKAIQGGGIKSPPPNLCRKKQ
jgi:hypothetical protein